jgi:hypothetical protein
LFLRAKHIRNGRAACCERRRAEKAGEETEGKEHAKVLCVDGGELEHDEND